MRLIGVLLVILFPAACSSEVGQHDAALNEGLTYDEIGQSVTYSDEDEHERYRASQEASAEIARQTIQDSIAPTEEERSAQRVAGLEQRLETIEKDAQYRRTREMLESGKDR